MSLHRVHTGLSSCPAEAIHESGVMPSGHEETLENLCAQCPDWAERKASSAWLLGDEELRERLAEVLGIAAANCGASWRPQLESAVQMVETNMEHTENGRHMMIREEDWQAFRRAAGLEG